LTLYTYTVLPVETLGQPLGYKDTWQDCQLGWKATKYL